MERTLTILNTFNNLIKLEHHRNFLECCRSHNLVPFDLRLKKTPSVRGKASADFQETLSKILKVAQSQLLSLILLQYRDQREKSMRAANDLLSRERSKITVEEMEHIRTQ